MSQSMMISQIPQALHAKRALLMMSVLFLSLLLGAIDGLFAQPRGIVSQQTEILISNSDRIRGWSWDGRTASYIATEDDGRGGKKSILYVMPFDGKTFGPVSFQYDNFSKSDRIRGWSWDGQWAVYVGLWQGKITVYSCSFDGRVFGPVQEGVLEMASGNTVRGYQSGLRNGSLAFVKNGKTYIVKQFPR